jgi:hypothetical protein
MRKIKPHYIPNYLREFANKGDVMGIMRARRIIWRRINKLIGIEAMQGLGFDGNTDISTLLETERKITENAAIRHALNQFRE